ncbi:PTS sugar transporter subunit IIA [Erysipelothrix tonsillarum]|uniref:PTS sugar transporter subunit IIA n=1 Tax=Erysipelothrix tonsillarum TaxID=38402 RepID=UPI000370DE02|nr:PTS sugar transporter subunit IIA [Erysipelothrix tonsillarum]
MSNLSIIIGTHGRFGEELIKSAEMIAGKLEHVHAVSLLPEYSFEDYMKKVDETLSQCDGPIIALVDIFGGTPSNVFTVLSKKYNQAVITGVNLPVLIDLYLSTRGETIDLDHLPEKCLTTLQESGTHTNTTL